MTDTKIGDDVAQVEFERWAEAMDLHFDTAEMDAEDLTEFNKQKGKIVRAIMYGHLIVNENGEAVYTPSRPNSKHQEAIVFHERAGGSLMAMDGKKKGHDVAKTYAVMAEMCRVHPGVFSGLVGTDIKICEALFALLMD